MRKPLNLPADLIKDWARRQTAASAKLEGRELPDDYERSQEVLSFLASRDPGPDPSLGLRPMRNANGNIVDWIIDD
jgi:hypothetical protein